MELTLVTLLKYYGVFCLTTLICCLGVQLKAIWDSGISFTPLGWVVYMALSSIAIVVTAPIFFITFIFASKSYYYKILEQLLSDELDSDD